MTVKTKTQLGVLGALVAAFVVIMLVRSSGEGQAGVSARPSNQAGRSGASGGVPAVADVNLEALKAEPEAPAAPERNLFVFRERSAPPAASSVRRTAPPPTTTAPPVPTGPPAPPPIPLKYIGVLEQGAGAGKVAIFSDGRGGTFYGREGEIIDGRYKVIKIGTESTEVSYVDGRGRQTLRLSGQ
jgi:hypothetical protein